jgi:hypothetical protein
LKARTGALVYCLLLAAGACGSRVQALDADYFPIQEGIVWRYDAEDDVREEMRHFLGTIAINGTIAHVLHYEGGPYDGRRDYWSQDAEGDVLYHGFSHPPLIPLWVLTPPILWYDFPLFVGKTWQTSPSQIDHRFEVTQQRFVAVPAGTFECFTIERTRAPGRVSFLASGVLSRVWPPFHTGWEDVAPGVGLVQSVTSWEQWRLRGFGTVTSVQLRTWSAVRSLYRQ